MNTTFDLRPYLRPVGDWLVAQERWLLNMVATFLSVLLILRGFWYGGDWLSGLCIGIGFFTVFVTCVIAFEQCYAGTAARTTRTVILGLLMLSWCVVGRGGSGYWVNARSGETTFTRNWLVSWPQPIYWVPQDFGQTLVVNVTTQDGVPLSCYITAVGISLDERIGRAQLERNFLELAQGGPVEPRISSALKTRLAEAAAEVLGSRTSETVTKQLQFYIPYRIGSPLQTTMERAFLYWNKGEITASCKVNFDK